MMFSILIPIFNNFKLFCDAIDSILSQIYHDYEVVVCDQSNDGSSQYIKNMCIECGFKYIKSDFPSLFKARRTLIENANGEYLIWLDSDDKLKNNTLSTLDTLIKEFDNPDLCFYGWSIINETNAIIKELNFVDNNSLDVYSIDKCTFLRNMLLSSDYNDLWNKCFSMKVYRKCSTEPIEEISMAEDFVRVQQLVQCCEKIIMINCPLYEYRINSASMTHVFKTNYWLDYGSYFSISFDLFSKYGVQSYDYKNNFLNFKLLELYNLIVLASKKKSNFKCKDIIEFIKYGFYEELRSYFIYSKPFNVKKRIILKLFFNKKYDLIILIRRFKKGV